MEKYLVVGAGFSGATIARLLAEGGNNVTVLDKRDVVGGNAYDCLDKNGILIQPYGPHIFHTNDQSVFDFVSRFSEWEKYEHKVLAKVRKDKFVPVPFNLNSLFSLFPSKAEQIKEILVKEIGYGKKVPILQLKQHEKAEIRAFADFVYKNIFYIYTMKQWGFKPEQLGVEVMNRVPVYLSDDDRYFTDTYQFMPKGGFTELITNMLRHPKIQIKLKTDVKKEILLHDGKIYYGGREFDGTLIYTGCVDELFDYKFGVLPYRSLKFKFKTLNQPSYQPSAVVNYTTSHKYTRITEFTKFTCKEQEQTVIVKEYPTRFKKGKNIPYYPIPIEKNFAHYSKYVDEAKNYKNLYLLGRLANYKYINMDVAVKNAMSLYEQLTGDEID
ncbi:MAG: UDP-galactopyranose mutase [Clostridiales bacterium]|nr:UDP-galactopyranose mutase [Clostridiales bacterium]